MKKLHPSVWIHFGAGVAIGLLFFLMPYYHFKLGFVLSLAITLVASILMASLKEWSDESMKDEVAWKKWDWMDWIFTVAGSLTIPLIVGLTLIF